MSWGLAEIGSGRRDGRPVARMLLAYALRALAVMVLGVAERRIIGRAAASVPRGGYQEADGAPTAPAEEAEAQQAAEAVHAAEEQVATAELARVTQEDDVTLFPRKVEELDVVVVVDWPDCRRKSYWAEIGPQLAPLLKVNVTEYPLAARTANAALALDRASANGGLRRVATDWFLEDYDVLVINWDAINGDPDFGADFAQRWFRHRRREILGWVAAGRVLIIEGQTVFTVPSQVAYDAVLGRGQLRVSGAHDEDAPGSDWMRIGSSCRYTRRARKSRLFCDLPNPSAEIARTHVDMFPPPASKALTPRLRRPGRDLYRGWFRGLPPLLRLADFRWAPLVKTADRRFDHPTLMVAKHAKGAIFASTMFLASAGQLELIAALLRAKGSAGDLPDPARPIRFLQSQATRVVTPLVLGAVVAAAAERGLQLDVAGGALAAAAVGAVVAFTLVQLPRLVRRLARDVVGW
jgi:hypothetical protein